MTERHHRCQTRGQSKAGITRSMKACSASQSNGALITMLSPSAPASLYGFKNERFLFPGIEHTVTYALMTIGGRDIEFDRMEFCWLAWTVDEMRLPERRVVLTRDDFTLFNPNTRTCPIFRTARDAEITRAIYRRVPVLVNETGSEIDNPWGLSFLRMFDMSNDSHLFRDRPGERSVPLYEAKFLHQFDHRWATLDVEVRDCTTAEKQDPRFSITPRYWVERSRVEERLGDRWHRRWLLAWRKIARATDARTFICTIIPRYGYSYSGILGLPAATNRVDALAANMNSIVFDYVTRQKLGGTNMADFITKQLPLLPPSEYDSEPPWLSGSTVGNWLAPRVLELTFVAWDLQPFAEEKGYHGPPFRWNPERRFLLRCELDAAFFHLYSINRDDVSHILETFGVVKHRDEARYGEYRTKRVILEAYEAMQRAIDTGEPYQTILDPPPADPRVAHPDAGATA